MWLHAGTGWFAPCLVQNPPFWPWLVHQLTLHPLNDSSNNVICHSSKDQCLHQGTNTHLPAMPCLHILDGCIFVMPCYNLSYQCSSRFSPSVVGLTYHIHPFMLHPTAFFHCDLCRDNTRRSDVHKPLTWFLFWNTYVLAKEMQASCSDLCTSLLWQPAWCYPCDCNVWTL